MVKKSYQMIDSCDSSFKSIPYMLTFSYQMIQYSYKVIQRYQMTKSYNSSFNFIPHGNMFLSDDPVLF